MKITFLGTGSSLGIPVISCKCLVCKSGNVKDKRLRSSVLVECEGKSILIDIGPDFRQQAVRAHINRIDALLLTHEHRDHVGGLDDIRAFNFIQMSAIDCYATARVIKSIEISHEYMFEEEKYPGLPELNLIEIDNKAFTAGKINIIPITATHIDHAGYTLPVTGFRIKDFTYLTDIKEITDEELQKAAGSKVIVLNTLRKEKHYSHLNIGEALDIIGKIRPERAYLTHISHMMGLHDEVQDDIPEGVMMAWDGLVAEVI